MVGARWWFWQAFLFVALLGLSTCTCAAAIPDWYDDAFKDATARYLPGRDWRELKAQCYQESLLKADAVSHAGAVGLCQFMPGTWRDIAPLIGEPLRSRPPTHPVASVHAAALYMRRLRGIWSAPRPDIERQRLAWGSYNAGAGNLIKAQRACMNAPGCLPPVCRDWPDISAALTSITGRHSHETITYVVRIERWLAQLRALD